MKVDAKGYIVDLENLSPHPSTDQPTGFPPPTNQPTSWASSVSATTASNPSTSWCSAKKWLEWVTRARDRA
jgi:hypothetical protein